MDMGNTEKIGWQLSGLFAGVAVSSLMVFACFGAALFLSGSIAEPASEEQVIASR